MQPAHPPHPLPRLFGRAAFPPAVSGLKMTGGFGTLSLFFLGVVRALWAPGLTCLTGFGVEVASLGRPRPLLETPEGPGTSESTTTMVLEVLPVRELALFDSAFTLSSPLVALLSELESSELESEEGVVVVSGLLVCCEGVTWDDVTLVPFVFAAGWGTCGLFSPTGRTGCCVGFTAPVMMVVLVVVAAEGWGGMAGMRGGGGGPENFVVRGTGLAVLLDDAGATTIVCLTGFVCLRGMVREKESTEILSLGPVTDLVRVAPAAMEVMTELARIWPGRESPVCGVAVSAGRCSWEGITGTFFISLMVSRAPASKKAEKGNG